LKIYHHLNEIPSLKKGVSLSIGNFDGVHLGHQKIIRSAIQAGLKRNIPTGVFTFKTHPQNVLHPEKRVSAILSLPQKMEVIQKLNPSFCMVAEVRNSFFFMSPEEFIEEILVKKFHIRVITLGQNFRFGCKASGSIDDLKKYQEKFGYRLKVISLIQFQGQTISSTRIRKAIQDLEFNLANRLLGRKIFFEGRVVLGKGIGKSLGFPTANLSKVFLPKEIHGVYEVGVWLNQKKYSGLLNAGWNPTVSSSKSRIIEIYLPLYRGSDFYCATLTFQIIRKLREEKKFKSLIELQKQIQRDVDSIQPC
jgi:riboflavin kinase / FMN adenylyltransferase